MEIQVCKPNPQYEYPDKNLIYERISKEKIKNINYELFFDILYNESGGKIKSLSEIESEIKKSMPVRYYLDPEIRKSVFAEYYNIALNRIEAIKAIEEFLEKYRDKIPDPVERTLFLIELLSKMRISQNNIKKDSVEELFTLEEELANLDQQERALLFKHNDKVKQMKILANSRIREILEISRKLDKFKTFSTRQIPSPPKEDLDGEDVDFVKMDKLSDIIKVPVTQRILDKKKSNKIYYKKLINNEYNKRTRIKRTDKKQIIYILLDGSGSMDERDKITQAIAIVFNRLKAVQKDEAAVWISTFDHELSQETVIANSPKDVPEVWDWIWKNHYSGSSTSIENAVHTAIDRIIDAQEKNPNLVKPDIILITDDDSSSQYIDSEKLKKHDIRLHGICVGQEKNPDLREKCVENNGIYLEL